MGNLMKQLANYENECCVFAFFIRQWGPTKEIADRLGVSERAVRYNKQQIKEGKRKCERSHKCLFIEYWGKPPIRLRKSYESDGLPQRHAPQKPDDAPDGSENETAT